MTSDSDLNVLSSQDLNFIFADDPTMNGIVNDTDMVLEDEDIVVPEEYNEVPTSEDLPGSFDFEVFMNPQESKNWMYSSLLKKVFIISNSDFPVEFKWNASSKLDLYVRVMPLYSNPQDSHKCVQRCIQHMQPSDVSNAGLTKLQSMHIMRCKNDQSRYDGGPNKHFSVVVPLGTPQLGMETVTQRFVFVCKNSCASGMNRRPIHVVFTLEDAVGNIYGRTSVNVRICSCPKRDKEKEERDHIKPENAPVMRGKKRKVVSTRKPLSFSDTNDGAIYSVNINVVGRRNYKAVIKYAQDLMAAEIVRYGNEEPFRSAYNNLENTLSYPKSWYNYFVQVYTMLTNILDKFDNYYEVFLITIVHRINLEICQYI